MKVRCVADGQWHDLSPTALAAVVEGFQEGDLQSVKVTGGLLTVTSRCILEALTEERLEKFRTRYPGHKVTVPAEEKT